MTPHNLPRKILLFKMTKMGLRCPSQATFKRDCFKTPGVVNEQNGGRGNAHTPESSLCTTMVEIWQRRISKGKLREILGSIFGNCAFPPQLERQQASGEGATYKDLVGVVAR